MEGLVALIQLLNRCKVRKYALNKLKQTETKYKTEITKRENAKNIIKPPELLSDIDYSCPQLRAKKLWSKFIPSDILKIIFMLTVSNVYRYNNQVLNLMLVCRDWRSMILKYENDEKFQYRLWHPLLNKFWEFDWKHLVLIPDKYLKLIVNLPQYREMTKNECQEYDELIGATEKDYDWGCSHRNADSNIPLLIAIIQKCPNIYHVELSGDLCEDIFFELNHLDKLGSISFSYSQMAVNQWFDHCIYPDSVLSKSLQHVEICRSYWMDDESMWYFSHCPNLESIRCEKPNISEYGLEYVFKGCKNLRSFDTFHGCIQGSLSKAFKALTENNKVIQHIGLDCNGVDDACLDHLMDPDVCPKLKTFHHHDYECSEEKLDEFKRNRPMVNVSEDEEEDED